MFFDGLIQRKLASVLRPWLTAARIGSQFRVLPLHCCGEEPLLRQAALNRLIGDGDGEEVRVLLKSVTIEEVCVRVAHLSAPAFTVEVRRVDVALYTEGPTEKRVYKRVEKSFNDYLQERTHKKWAQIDPEFAFVEG